MENQRYQEALDFIYSHIDYSIERSFRYAAEVFDLARVRDLFKALGNPQESYPSIHIAGTKGKGSTAALIASATQAAGYRTGLYSSPHLQRFTERICVDGMEISELEVADMVEDMKPHVAEIDGLTAYEIITALGFLYFEKQGVNCAVIEVGLGGRLDATNIIKPMTAVITSLSYDHMHLLGNSLSDIAREKAGIIKPEVPIVMAPQLFEAERVVEDVAEKMSAPLVKVGRDWLFSAGRHSLEGQNFSVWSAKEQPLMDAYVESAGVEEWIPPRFSIPLLGHHQVINAAVAYAALQCIRDQGMNIPEKAIRDGFTSVRWRGRLEIVSRDPLVLVDSAHNRDSALKLRIALDDYFPGQRVILIFGASVDKDISGMFAELLPRVWRVILTQAVHPRAADPKILADMVHATGVGVDIVVPVADSIAFAMQEAGNEDVILATGSLFVAGEVIAAIEAAEAQKPEDLEEGAK
jgi:dihydrofolate synthase/folylpolyglutamate synthase